MIKYKKFTLLLVVGISCGPPEPKRTSHRKKALPAPTVESHAEVENNSDATSNSNNNKNPDGVGPSTTDPLENENPENTGNTIPVSADDAKNFNYACEEIGKGVDEGFFSMEVFKDQLYIGGFGYKKKPSLFRYPTWEVVSPGLVTSESVCDMREFKGYLYANTEQDGYVYRSADGTTWQKVFDDEGGIGCVLREYQDKLYATITAGGTRKGGKIYRSGDGLNWEVVYNTYGKASEDMIKDLIEYKGVFYAFYFDGASGKSGYLKSTDGKNWQRKELGYVRLFKALIWNDQLYASMSPYPDSPNNNKPGLWKMEGDSFVEQGNLPEFKHFGDIVMYDQAIFGAASKKWKSFEGGGSLVMSVDEGKTWQKACEFKETEAWNVVVYKNELFVSTKQTGGGGKVYKVKKTHKVDN